MKRTGCAIVLAVLAVHTSANAQILLNGWFESPTITANSFQFATPTSWSWGSSIALIFNGSVFDPKSGTFWPLPQSGQQFVDIGNVSAYSLSQSFTIAGGGTYQLAWYDNTHSAGLTSPYSVSVRNASLQLVASMNLDAAHGGVWQNRALFLHLDPGIYTLTFAAQGITDGFDTLLDTVTITSAANAPILDVDASITSTKYDGLTDGLLIIRYLLGLTGNSLASGAIGATATRSDPAAIKAYLDGIRPALDIDGNGTAAAPTDGLLILRYLLGLRGDALIDSAVNSLATRKTAQDIEAYLLTLMP